MNEFSLRQGQARELLPFPFIQEFALEKNSSVKLNALHSSTSDCVRIYFVVDGKYEWTINSQHHVLYPGDLACILPGKTFGGDEGILNIGVLCCIRIQLKKIDAHGIDFGSWSSLSDEDRLAIGKILLQQSSPVLKLKDSYTTLTTLHDELVNQEIGFTTRVHHLTDELLIGIARQLTRQNTIQRDFPQTFMKFEKTLRKNLAHQWTVEEMAGLMSFGTTTFTEKVKKYTGFSPLNYLINLRISEAVKLLNQKEENVTDIALSTGFYSSQHFSTTFKKLTGYTPSAFRKRNLPQKK